MSNEIVKAEPNSLEAYVNGLNEKLAFCQTLIKSGLVPSQFKTPEAVLAVILKGQELGFSPMQSVESFDFIQGRVTIRAAGISALVQANGGSIEVVEETETKCTIKATRPDRKWTQTYTFTIEDATKMGLTGKDNWRKMPKFMLYARAVSVIGRRGWADRLGGLYSTEEMQDSNTIDVTPKASNGAHKSLPPVVVAEELPPAKPFYYSTAMLPEHKKEDARAYLDQQGAFYDEDLKVWQSPKRIAKMDKYLVEVQKEAQPNE